MKGRYVRNKDKIRAQQKRAKELNPEKYRKRACEIGKRYAKRHPDRVAAARMRWRKKNPEAYATFLERAKLASREYRKSANFNKERADASKRNYVERNREKVTAAKKKYVEQYPHRVKATLNNNKSRRRLAPGEITDHQWRTILNFYLRSCGICKTPAKQKRLSVDHFIPISKGGSNHWNNIWPLCMPCNMKKHAHIPDASGPPHADKFILNNDNKLVLIPAFSFARIADTKPSKLISIIYGERKKAA